MCAVTADTVWGVQFGGSRTGSPPVIIRAQLDPAGTVSVSSTTGKIDTNYGLRGISCLSDQEIWVTGDCYQCANGVDAVIAHTSDGGKNCEKNWEQSRDLPSVPSHPYGLWKISFAGEKR